MIKHKKMPQHPTFSFWWQWWSDWDDVVIFNYDYCSHLLQASRSRIGMVRFRVASMEKSPLSPVQCGSVTND